MEFFYTAHGPSIWSKGLCSKRSHADYLEDGLVLNKSLCAQIKYTLAQARLLLRCNNHVQSTAYVAITVRTLPRTMSVGAPGSRDAVCVYTLSARVEKLL